MTPNDKLTMTEQEERRAIDRAFDRQIKDMTSTALIYAASAVGMLLLWLGGPTALAVMMPALTFSVMSLTRSRQLAKLIRRRARRPDPNVQTATRREESP
jgi:hypothetical protein